ncbi:MAG TPA: glycosyltransferase [Longimicrobium sp.]|nr:glycosyltransferase [Longimicrobium sp.]
MRILWISDSPLACTGYGTVTREILARLRRLGYDVAAIGWGYAGGPYDRAAIPYDIYPSDARLFGRDAAVAAIQHFRPDVLVALGDLWMVDWLKDLQVPHPHRLVVYFPVDGKGFPRAWERVVRRADAAVAYSWFGHREVTAACPGLEVEMIYHGVDLDTFRPLGLRAELQASRGLGGRFVVGCVARNQTRKQFPVLIEAFARFAQSCDEALLYLHTDPRDVGWDLVDLVRRHGVAERTAFSTRADVVRGVTPAGLNEIYNLMDVMALPTTGEGFGVPLLEAMAAGVPVMATRCSACEELVEGRGELVDVAAFIAVSRHAVQHALPSADDLAARLARLHADPALRERHVRAGREFAAGMSWDQLMPQWQSLFARLA